MPCAEHEITSRKRSYWRAAKMIQVNSQGKLQPLRLAAGPEAAAAAAAAEAANGTAAAAAAAAEESDDAMLERLGVLENMAPKQSILFGVMTGSGMEARCAARAWCACSM